MYERVWGQFTFTNTFKTIYTIGLFQGGIFGLDIYIFIFIQVFRHISHTGHFTHTKEHTHRYIGISIISQKSRFCRDCKRAFGGGIELG